MCFLELESDVGEKKTAWDGSKVFVLEVGKGLRRHGGERLGWTRLLSRVFRTPSCRAAASSQRMGSSGRVKSQRTCLRMCKKQTDWRKQQSSSEDQRTNV